MDTDHFWDVIEAARVSAREGKPFHEVLTDLLAARTEQKILDYQDKYQKAADSPDSLAGHPAVTAADRRTWTTLR